MIEMQVKIAAKLYHARDTMRKFWGKEYLEQISTYQEYIRNGMIKFNCDELQSTMKCIEILQSKQIDSGIMQAMFLASYVEMIEPSQP